MPVKVQLAMAGENCREALQKLFFPGVSTRQGLYESWDCHPVEAQVPLHLLRATFGFVSSIQWRCEIQSVTLMGSNGDA